MENKNSKSNLLISAVIIIFGLMTIVAGARALFTDVGQQSRGNTVPLVLWFNFVAGFFYVLAGISALRLKVCVKKLSMVLAVTNVTVFIYFLSHILLGGLYENRTLVAMSIRTLFWISLTVYFFKSSHFKQINCRC